MQIVEQQMQAWEKQFLKYCLKKGLLKPYQARQITNQYAQASSQGVGVPGLISTRLAWDQDTLTKHLQEFQHQMAPPQAASGAEADYGSVDLSAQSPNAPTALGTQEQSQEEPPTKLGAYTLLEQIGVGGMGVVYKAYHKRLDKYFAIKTLHAGKTGKVEIQRLIREARLAAKLRHPNIVAVHDVAEEGAHYYIVMDYIQGRDLGKVIANEKLSPRECLKIVLQVAQALELAHSQGIIHRDIKPSNILLDDSRRCPYLMDFGLATIEETDLTRSGELIGTPQYMSPEQAHGRHKQLDGRSDIYSLGAVLYELLAGKPVLEGDNMMQILYQLVSQEPVPLSRQRRGIAPDIEAITMKCLEKEPKRRYATAAELAADIERYLNGEAVLAKAPTRGYILWRWVRKNKMLATTLAVATLIILGGGIWSMVTLKREKDLAVSLARRLQEALARSEHDRQQLAAALKLAEQRRLEAQEANRKQRQQQHAQRLLDEALQAAHTRRPFLAVQKKLQQAQALAPWYPDLYREWGRLYYEYGLREANQAKRNKFISWAQEKLKQATRLDPKDYRAWFYLFLISQQLGDQAGMHRAVRQIFSLNLRNEYGALGRALRFEHDAAQAHKLQQRNLLHQKALQAYNMAIRYNPSFCWAYLQRAQLYIRMRQLQAALYDYNKALQYMPPENRDLVYRQRGQLYTLQQRWSAAIEDYTHAIRLQSTDLQAYRQRGLLYYRLGQYRQALSDLEECRKHGLDDPVVQKHRRLARQALQKH